MVDQLTMRASDRDRQQVVDRLRSALEDGRLTMDQYVGRMEAAYQAATYGNLVPLYADLPASPPVIAGPQTAAGTAAPPTVFSQAGSLHGLPTVLKILWTIWLTAVAVNVVVWALVSGTGGHLAYPWPVWVAGPYGTVLFAVSAGVVLFRRGRPPHARTYARLMRANRLAHRENLRMDTPLTGVVPVVPTIFHDDQSVDLGGTARVVDYLIDAGVDGLCLLANYSEQFSLTDAERDAIARTLLERVAGRLPVIVATSHYSARVTAERSRAAQDMGAAMVMIMSPFFGATLTVPGPAVIEYFKQVADIIDIPVMVQDAPLSSTPLPVSLLINLVRQVPQVQYAKIEVPQAADKLHALVSALGSSLPGPFDGEESVTLIPDLDAGATGTMPSSTVPAELGQIICRYAAGDRATAVSAWENLLPLIHFENRQCGLRAQKILLAEGGIVASDRTRAPFGRVRPGPAAG